MSDSMPMRKRAAKNSLMAGLLLLAAGAAHAADVFRTDLAVPPTPAGQMLGAEASDATCVFQAPAAPLRLDEAVARALCNNPKTREAWAAIMVQAAGVGVAMSAYMPSISANWQATRDQTVTTIYNYPDLSSRQQSNNQAYNLSLSWILYDFGGREAGVRNAKALLAAAQASHMASLQETFMNTAKDYFTAQAAYGSMMAAREIEQSTMESFNAASRRVEKGVAPVSDQLQAQTSYAQSVVNRTKAVSEWKSAIGTLMSDMDIDPDDQLRLPDAEEEVSVVADFTKALDALMADAKQNHPSVRAAQLQLEAAQDKVDKEIAAGMPTLNMIGKYSGNRQPIAPSLGEQGLPARSQERYLGVQLTVPLFDGFNRTYQVRQAEAQVEAARANLAEARRKVVLDVWGSEYNLRAATENVGNSDTLLQIAKNSRYASLQRYQAGVGNIVELLNTESALATARKQRIQALTDWRIARVQLAASLGKLGM